MSTSPRLSAMVALALLAACGRKPEAGPTPAASASTAAASVAVPAPSASSSASASPLSTAAPAESAAPNVSPKAQATVAGSCPPNMASIPAGSFLLGNKDGKPVEKPVRQVNLESFCMDQTEVTVANYEECVNAKACRPATEGVTWGGLAAADKVEFDKACNSGKSDRSDHPINCVDSVEAAKYCTWMRKRLPTEIEWEYVARGGEELRPYPWGSERPDKTRLNVCGAECLQAFGYNMHVEARSYYQEVQRKAYYIDTQFGRHFETTTFPDTSDDYPQSAPVGKLPAGDSRWGVHDMMGNVWEWTSSQASTNYDAPRDPRSQIVRGAGWSIARPAWVRPTYRYFNGMYERSHDLGFRCVSSVGAPPADSEGPPPVIPECKVPPIDIYTADAQAFGNHCYLNYKCRKLDEAESDCKAGLAKREKTMWVHGALYFNMGLIAQKRGNREAARGFYEKSLEVRPVGWGVATTKKALAELLAGAP